MLSPTCRQVCTVMRAMMSPESTSFASSWPTMRATSMFFSS